MTYWQIANGDASRDYSQVFLDFGVACVGPGRWGSCHNDTWERLYEFQKVPSNEMDRIRHFLRIKAGNRIILKSGRQKAIAIGDVIEMDGRVYHHSDSFADVDGWDLQHTIRVNWKVLNKDFQGNVFDRRTVSRFAVQGVIDELEQLASPLEVLKPKHHIHDLSFKPTFDYEYLEQCFVWVGVRTSDAENISKTIRRIERLAHWYLGQKDLWAGEHEIRTFLVVPLLDALGWAPQQIRIEKEVGRKKMDLLLYASPQDERPCLLIETKRMYEGSAQAIAQALWYIENLDGLNHLTTYCVTDGIRYWRYDKGEQGWAPSAYMNFERPRPKYLAYPHLAGMYDFLLSLQLQQFTRR
jgi:hypothetical protein